MNSCAKNGGVPRRRFPAICEKPEGGCSNPPPGPARVKKDSRGYGKKPLAVLWYEAEAGRDAENVTVAFWHYLQQNRNKKRIVIYAYNCSAQQKLWPQKVVTQKRLRYRNPAYVFAECKVIEKKQFRKKSFECRLVHGGLSVDMRSNLTTCYEKLYTSMSYYLPFCVTLAHLVHDLRAPGAENYQNSTKSATFYFLT